MERSDDAEARDPSTPPARLAALLATHTDAVLQNPALPLLVTEDPDFWAGLTDVARSKVAASTLCPPSFAQWELRRPDAPAPALGELAMNPALALDLRRKCFLHQLDASPIPARADFLGASELRLLRAGVDAASLSGEDVTQLTALGRAGELLALRHPDCPPSLLVAYLAVDPGANDWVLSRAPCPAALVAAALASTEPGAGFWAAQNPRLTAAQCQLAYDAGHGVSLGQNRGLSAEWAERLVRSEDLYERDSVASNPVLTPEQQLVLADDDDPGVRDELRSNPSLTVEARLKLEEKDAK
jgi:hypothetical protein